LCAQRKRRKERAPGGHAYSLAFPPSTPKLARRCKPCTAREARNPVRAPHGLAGRRRARLGRALRAVKRPRSGRIACFLTPDGAPGARSQSTGKPSGAPPGAARLARRRDAPSRDLGMRGESPGGFAPSGACFLLATSLCAVQGGRNVAGARDGARATTSKEKWPGEAAIALPCASAALALPCAARGGATRIQTSAAGGGTSISFVAPDQ
jgi:hypothetical protein